ncbi:DUF3291 domain-containing protein [Xinfangfangia sp. D13-10-4-6]|nr:DUF3291 domain-containing protein [Pseudogemmobacter hezensis]
MRPGYHLAVFNFGLLRHDWDAPEIADFANGLDLVNGIAARAPGFVWRLDDEAMEAAQAETSGPFAGDPRMASTLSVWEDADSLGRFVWTTVHRQFYARKGEWYDAPGEMVLWFIPAGHRPDMAEGHARWKMRKEFGDSDQAFGWSYLEEAATWKAHDCGRIAAE